jgi:hypothetical protein
VLYWAPNASDTSAITQPAADALIAVCGKVLLSVTGLQQQPAKNISVVDLVFRDSAPTFLDRHDLPSQSDWGLVHTGAVIATGTEAFTMQGCLITRADGQGLLLEGYHRGARILENHFDWIGSHALVSWGKTSPCLNENCSRKVPNGGDGPDGRNGEQPRGTLVQGNIVHDTGIYERQGTMWNQALSAETTLRGNIFFNCDRASLNVNGGFRGGNYISGNLLFNTGRAAGKDEGSVNSWDRVPYITTLRNGTASTIPAWNYVTGNFLLANYNPSAAIDSDDGSSFWQHHKNFVVYGQAGFKLSPQGSHNMRAFGNYYAHVDAAYNAVTPDDQHGGWASSDGWFVNNTVIVGGASFSYFGNGYASDCFMVGKPQFADSSVSGNTVLSKLPLTVQCLNASAPTKGCTLSCTLDQWLAQGHDPGTTVGPLPQDEVVIAAARVLLGIPKLINRHHPASPYVRRMGVVPTGGGPTSGGRTVPVGDNHSLAPCATGCDAATSCLGFSVVDAYMYAPSSCKLHAHDFARLVDVPCATQPAVGDPPAQFVAFFSKPEAVIPGKPPYQQFAGLMPLHRAKTVATIPCNNNFTICTEACDADVLCVGINLATCSPEAPGKDCWLVHKQAVPSLVANTADHACFYAKPGAPTVPMAPPAMELWSCGTHHVDELFIEMYDLDTDPHQLKNLASGASLAQKAELHAMAVKQFGCSGADCS